MWILIATINCLNFNFFLILSLSQWREPFFLFYVEIGKFIYGEKSGQHQLLNSIIMSLLFIQKRISIAVCCERLVMPCI